MLFQDNSHHPREMDILRKDQSPMGGVLDFHAGVNLRLKHVDSNNRIELTAGRCFPRDLLGVSHSFRL